MHCAMCNVHACLCTRSGILSTLTSQIKLRTFQIVNDKFTNRKYQIVVMPLLHVRIFLAIAYDARFHDPIDSICVSEWISANSSMMDPFYVFERNKTLFGVTFSRKWIVFMNTLLVDSYFVEKLFRIGVVFFHFIYSVLKLIQNSRFQNWKHIIQVMFVQLLKFRLYSRLQIVPIKWSSYCFLMSE